MKDLRCIVGIHDYGEIDQSQFEYGGIHILCTRCKRSKFIRTDGGFPSAANKHE